ncbi:MAG: hypothetical protein WC554_17065 [Clostridia bacterium]|jgi:hypothetical protein
MPYTSIVFVKLFWKDLIYDDKRFIEQLSDQEKGLYLMLLLLAGSTDNKIPYNAEYIKITLHLDADLLNIITMIDKILSVYPKLIKKGNFLKFKNFNKLTNQIRIAEEYPTFSREQITLVLNAYLLEKGFNPEIQTGAFLSQQYARYTKTIKKLLSLSSGEEKAVEAIKWIKNWLEKAGLNWTLETVVKHYDTFLGSKDKQTNGVWSSPIK